MGSVDLVSVSSKITDWRLARIIFLHRRFTSFHTGSFTREKGRALTSKPSTLLVARGKMSTYRDIFYRKKPPSKNVLTRTRSRKDPTRRQGQRDKHRTPYWTRVTTFFPAKSGCHKPPGQFSIFFRPHITIHRDLSIGSASKSIEGVEYRKRQSRAHCRTLLFDGKKFALYGYVTFVLTADVETFTEIVTIEKPAKRATLITFALVYIFFLTFHTGTRSRIKLSCATTISIRVSFSSLLLLSSLSFRK